MGTNCNHPTCNDICRRPKKQKKIYRLKRTPIKRTVPKGQKNAKGQTELLKLAQMVFNKWIRARDVEKPCISSGNEVMQAGHYYPAGSFSGVRFDEINVNGQNVEDNCFKCGNEKEYRMGLIERYGEPAVLALDERAKASKFYKWSCDELLEIIKKYKL